MEQLPTPVFFTGESHGQRNLVGYSPQGREESDMTERARTHAHTHTHRDIQHSHWKPIRNVKANNLQCQTILWEITHFSPFEALLRYNRPIYLYIFKYVNTMEIKMSSIHNILICWCFYFEMLLLISGIWLLNLNRNFQVTFLNAASVHTS